MNVLSTAQISQIVEAIDSILREARASLHALDVLCDKDYMNKRKAHEITGIVYSAFPPGKETVDGFTIVKRRYGLDMFLPELQGDDLVLQLYSSGAKPYETSEVKSRLSQLESRFYLLEFTISPELYRLARLDIVLLSGFTEKGNVSRSQREKLYAYDTA